MRGMNSDQILLHHLRLKVAALEQAVRAHNRQHNVMLHTRGLTGGEQVATGRLEKLQGFRAIEAARIRHVHDNLRAGQRCGESFTGDGIDARPSRC
jgi:hypothetical protein